jgi:hypothetical protein
MGQNLATKTPGAPDNTFAWYLQTSGGTLASGFRVADGLGNDTPLWLKTGEVGVVNAGGFRTVTQTAATQTRTVTWADASGTVEPALLSVLAADATSTSVTLADTGLSLAVEADGVYEIDAILMVTSAATTTGVVLGLSGPATTWVGFEMSHATATGPAVDNVRTVLFATLGSSMANVDAPAANTTFPVRIRGMLKVSGTTPASNVRIRLATEVAASSVAIKAGSYLRLRRMA